jgi:hypothetical protein
VDIFELVQYYLVDIVGFALSGGNCGVELAIGYCNARLS